MKERMPPAADERQPLLVERQQLKMASSAHAYVRGSTARFYQWLEENPPGSLPEGPAVWICGDCHVGNLGPVADVHGRVGVQIRDLDQTVVGNPAHDLLRLGLSLASAARGADLPGVTTARMIEHMVRGYEEALAGEPARKPKKRPRAVRFALERALGRSWRHLLEERVVDTRATIPLGERFWPLSRDERRAVDELFASEGVRRLVAALRERPDDSTVEVADAAFWVKGCSSLGRLRLAVLVKVDEGRWRDGMLSLIDVKEAHRALAPRYTDSDMPKTNAERVVFGARALSPFLGERMLPAELLGASVFLRELLPQDLKIELDTLPRNEAKQVARYLAGVVGRAHARQMDRDTRERWTKELSKHRPKTLDAPTWLWRAVVDLVAQHEAAYLEHCRKYALARKSRA